MQHFSFVRVTPSYRGIVNADIEAIWPVVKQWAPSLWIREIKGIPCHFHVLTGESGEQIGAIRATVIGSGVVVEQLVAVDAEEHYMTWKCISDPRSINPFPGSFVNYINTLRFTALTSRAQTIAEWQGELWTDPETAEVMTTILADFYREALKSLEKQLNAGNADPSGQRKLLPNGRKDPVTMQTLMNAFPNSLH